MKQHFITGLVAGVTLITVGWFLPLAAQTLRPDSSGIPQSAPATGGGAAGVGTGNDVKVGVAGLTRRGLDKNVTIVLRGNGQSASYNAGGRDVTVQGTGNTIRLRGKVRRLTVIGNANRVSTEVVERVAITGAGNGITYRRGVLADRPQVTQNGARNQVTKRK